jgi:hypothetical protein
VSCTLQAGVGQLRSVLIFQDRGEPSSDTPTVSYELCSPGFESQGLGCSACKAGFFAQFEGQEFCLPCPQGSFNNVTQSVSCKKCTSGRFTPASGRSRCSNCVAGRFAAFDGATECLPCLFGTFNAVNGSTGALARCVVVRLSI